MNLAYHQVELPVVYKSVVLDCSYRIDLVVEKKRKPPNANVPELAPHLRGTCLLLVGYLNRHIRGMANELALLQ